MPDYKKAAANARTPAQRTRFLRLWREERARTAITTCEGCSLAETRTCAVPWSGPTSSPIVLVGEAPGRYEDQEGVPFVGASGRVLATALHRAGLERDDTMVMNTVCCRPPKNRDPLPAERAACRKHFDAQLRLSSAYVGVLLGKQAYGAVTGEDRFQLSDVRGKPFWMDGRVWVTTYHPAYVLRNRQATGALIGDLTIARKITTSSQWWPRIDPADIETFGAKDTRLRVKDEFRKHGWVRLYLRRLGDTVLVLEHADVTVPEKHKHLPRYTLDELVRLGETIKVRGVTADELKRVHLVKSAFAGTIVT